MIAEPIETLINNDIPLKERAETKAPIDKPLYSNDVQSMQEESAPQVVPEMPHNTIENKEVETLYIEAVEDFSSAYKKFFEEISVFNQNTLDMQGVETTGSILSQAEITNIIKKLGNEVSTTPNQTLSVINDVQNYLMENAFPITNGALITAKDGYDHVLNATEQLYISLGVFYQKLQKIGKEKEVGMLIKQLDNDIQTLDEVLNKKKQHVNDYFSR